MSEPLSPFDRLYDVCDANGLEACIQIFEYARKRGGRYQDGRLGIIVKKDGEAVNSWNQGHGSTLSLQDLSIQALNWLDKQKMI
jgi:hypothetical protein